MKLRTGRVLVGFAVGYYLGSKAGRERYVQLDAALHRLTSAPGFRGARQKVAAALDLGTMAAKDAMSEALAYDDEAPTVEMRWDAHDDDRYDADDLPG